MCLCVCVHVYVQVHACHSARGEAGFHLPSSFEAGSLEDLGTEEERI